MTSKRFVAAILLLLATGAAQAQSMEERLRDQLRATAAQLSQAQGQQAQLATDKAAAEQARDAAQAEAAALREQLAAAQAQLDSLNANNQALYKQAQDIADQANAQIAQTKSAYHELTKTAQAKEAERAQAQLLVTRLQAQTQACAAKNENLYAVGREILGAYERVGSGSVFASRQPFAAKARVRLEEAAQAMGDRLYAEKFDPNAAAKAADTQAQPASAEPAQEQAK